MAAAVVPSVSLVGLAVVIAPLVLLGMVIHRLGNNRCGAAEPARGRARWYAVAALLAYVLMLLVPLPHMRAMSRRRAPKREGRAETQSMMAAGALWGLQWLFAAAALWALRHEPTKGGCRGMLFALLILPIALAALLFLGGGVMVYSG